MKTVSQADHDRVVAFIARNRFPFPGQKDWPSDSVTLTNRPMPRRSIDLPSGPHFPDIVVVGADGGLREVAEVETEVNPERARIWAAGSAASDNRTKTGVKHFFVYVPEGMQRLAQELLEQNGISFAGLRVYSIAEDGTIRITPIVTTGDPKDHVESVSR